MASAVAEPMVMVSRVTMRAHSWMAIDFIFVVVKLF